MINPGGGSQARADRDTGGDTELSFQGTGSKTALSVAGEAEASEPQVLDLGQFLPLQGCSLLCEVGSAVCGDHSLCRGPEEVVVSQIGCGEAEPWGLRRSLDSELPLPAGHQ